MLEFNRHAFKEWSVVCAALAKGKQSLILRKGGVEDGAEGIRIEKPEFWLYPTYLHQEQQPISDALIGGPLATTPVSGSKISIRNYAVVQRADFISTEVALARLQKFHVWSNSTIAQRFHYRKPGLWAMIVRIFELDKPFEIEQSAEMAGCRSWVELPDEFPTPELRPVLSDDEFETTRAAIETQLKP